MGHWLRIFDVSFVDLSKMRGRPGPFALFLKPPMLCLMLPGTWGTVNCVLIQITFRLIVTQAYGNHPLLAKFLSAGELIIEELSELYVPGAELIFVQISIKNTGPISFQSFLALALAF